MKFIKTTIGHINLEHVTHIEEAATATVGWEAERGFKRRYRLFFNCPSDIAETGSDQAYITLYDREGAAVRDFIENNYLAQDFTLPPYVQEAA